MTAKIGLFLDLSIPFLNLSRFGCVLLTLVSLGVTLGSATTYVLPF
jgi:hypothetical protein